MDHLTTIIINYNTTEDTNECLESLSQLTENKHFKHQIIIVDNGSKIPYSVPEDVGNLKIKLIHSEKNLGFTGGNNLGISDAIKTFQTDYILLLNSDTVVDKDFLNYLYKPLKEDSTAVISSPKIYFYKNNEYHKKSYSKEQHGNVVWYAGGNIDWQHLTAHHRGVDEVDREQFNNLTTSDFATGCCLLFKRELIERVGIFDKNYFLYLEDVDLSKRATLNGLKLLFIPQSLVWHKNASSSDGSGGKTHDYYLTRNRFYFFLKYGNWKIRLLALKLIIDIILKESGIKKRAILDLLLGRMGKQTILG